MRILLLAAFFAFMGSCPSLPPTPEPTPTPIPTPTPEPWACELDMPGCHDTGQSCSAAGAPCWHNPTLDPEHCEEAPACPVEPLPQPQCTNDPEGACDCYRGLVFVGCPTPPPPGDCPLFTPSAGILDAAGKRVEIRPKKEGKRAFGATPLGAFGTEYYCQELVAWPEACAEGRKFGPVAPDGHPDRVVCEQAFLELDCANLEVVSRGHMSLDPWLTINGVNQNHPRNVAQGCGTQFVDHNSWRKEDYNHHLYIVEGQMAWTTVHGNGQVCAEARNGVGRRCVSFTDPKN